MATKKPLPKPKKPTAASHVATPTPAVPARRRTWRQRRDAFLARRPHRSFRRTRRRDYVRTLALPGYWAFTHSVRRTLWQHRKLFLGLTAIYALLIALMVGIGSQDTYTTLTDTLSSTSGGVLSGGLGALGQASLLLATTVSGSLSQNLTEVQQVYAVILGLLTWLTTIWLLRNVLAGHKVKLRDGLYSSGAPILATFLVGLVFIVQLLPLALALIGYSAASSTGLLTNGVEAMLFWAAAGLLVVLSLYWITSTFFALVIVTLPGMYPLRALKTAGDLVIGRRLRILLRILWLALLIVLIWVVIMIPIILLDSWLKSIWPGINWLPLVPVALLVMSSLTLVGATSYIYLLYRKVVADDTEPA